MNGAIVAANQEVGRAMHALFKREDFQVKINIIDFLSVNFNDREPFKAYTLHRCYTIVDKQCPVPINCKSSNTRFANHHDISLR